MTLNGVFREDVVDPAPSSDASLPDVLALSSSEFLGLCREALARGVEVRFEARGLSMRPALKPGDVLCAEPLGGCIPEVGEVVLFENAAGLPVVHRIVGRRRGRSGWLLITAGDGHPMGALEAVLPVERVLARVRAYERDGVRRELQPRCPALWDNLRARWALWSADHSSVAAVVRPWLSCALRAGRSLLGILLNLFQRARRWPLVGRILCTIWPDLGDRCQVEVTASTGPWERCLVVDAIFRGRSIGRVSLHKGYVGGVPADEWWLSGEYVEPLYRRRGVATTILREALRLAEKEGAREVRVATATNNTANLTLLARLGFLPETDGTRAGQVNAYFRSLNPGAHPVVVLRRRLDPAEDSRATESGS